MHVFIGLEADLILKNALKSEFSGKKGLFKRFSPIRPKAAREQGRAGRMFAVVLFVARYRLGMGLQFGMSGRLCHPIQPKVGGGLGIGIEVLRGLAQRVAQIKRMSAVAALQPVGRLGIAG